MRTRTRLPRIQLALAALLALVLAGLAGGVFAENIDPANDNSQWAWGENVGWINAEPSAGGLAGVTVGNSYLTGYMWGENTGWISLNCANTSSCFGPSGVNYSVSNDGSGALGGWAWSENAGWINFSCETLSTCGTVNFGVNINMTTGVFSGEAWGENIGWITFSDTSPVAYQVRTGWPAVSGDTDGDGCPDVKEQQTAVGSELSGGRRDYVNPWDYFNPSGDGVNRVDDILAVVSQYHDDDTDGNPGLPPYAAGYNPGMDRTTLGPNAWNLGPPNGQQRVDDILSSVYQYHHDCS